MRRSRSLAGWVVAPRAGWWRRRRVSAAAVAVIVGVVGAAAPAGARPTRAAVEQLLQGYERVPTTAELARPGTAQVLMEIHVDERAAPLLRVRALGALGRTPSRQGVRFLRDVVRRHVGARTGLRTLFLRRAAAALLAADGRRGAATVSPLLRHPAPDVRIEVARALARRAPREALPALQRRLGTEPLAAVRAVLARELARLRRGMPRERRGGRGRR